MPCRAESEVSEMATILVVEDEPELLRVVAKALREMNYAVDEAGDGRSEHDDDRGVGRQVLRDEHADVIRASARAVAHEFEVSELIGAGATSAARTARRVETA